MSTRNELALSYYNAETWGNMKAMAEVLVRSGALPKDVKNAEQCMIKMQTGLEMGMPPMRAMQGLYIVNGMVNIWGKEIIWKLKEHGWDVEYEYEYDNETEDLLACTVTVSKRLEANTIGNLSKPTTRTYKQKFTLDMAVQSGYTKTRDGDYKVGWLPGANLELKLGYNALAMILKKYLPEVLGPAAGIVELADQYEGAEQVEIKVSESEDLVQNPVPNDPKESKKTENLVKKAKKESKNIKKAEAELDEKLRKKQKEFFALVHELGGDAEAFKEKLKDKYWPRDAKGNKIGEFSFNDLNEIQVVGAISILRTEISKRKAQKQINDTQTENTTTEG